ncbi:MAG: hypothetical protein PGN11_05850 [Quadrisphaera sp.]
MSEFLFPDNTVLCNYGAVKELALLESLLRGNGRWTQGVYLEARRSTSFVPPLATIFSTGWLGAPIEVPNDAAVERLRVAAFDGDPDIPTEHLGEAETCYLIKNDVSYSFSTWITDDEAAFEFAKRQGITTWDTRDTVERLIADGDITAQRGFDLMGEMWEEGRTPRRMPDRWQDLR